MKIEVTILIWRKKCSISWKVIWKPIVHWPRKRAFGPPPLAKTYDNLAHIDFAKEMDSPVGDKSLPALLCAHYCHYHLEKKWKCFEIWKVKVFTLAIITYKCESFFYSLFIKDLALISINTNLICIVDEEEIVFEDFIVCIPDYVQQLRQVEQNTWIRHYLLGINSIKSPGD